MAPQLWSQFVSHVYAIRGEDPCSCLRQCAEIGDWKRRIECSGILFILSTLQSLEGLLSKKLVRDCRCVDAIYRSWHTRFAIASMIEICNEIPVDSALLELVISACFLCSLVTGPLKKTSHRWTETCASERSMGFIEKVTFSSKTRRGQSIWFYISTGTAISESLDHNNS